MFTLGWLAWYVAFLKRWLDRRVREIVDDTTGGDEAIVAATMQALYVEYAELLRLAWFGTVMFIMAEANRQGAYPGFIPAHRGVSPKLVERVLREEIRVTKSDGKEQVTGNIDEISERISSRLGTYIPAVERQIVEDMGAPIEEVARIAEHRAQHGDPLTRFMEDSQDVDSPLGRLLDSNDDLKEEFEQIVEDWRDNIKSTEGGILEAGDTGLDEWELDIRGEMQRTIFEAEIFFGLRDEMPEGSNADFARMSVYWARIPVGSYTCGFCLMLCARGAVYRSDTALNAKSRAEKGLTPFQGAWNLNAYHEHCDCMMVPVYSWDNYAGKDLTDGARKLYNAYKKDEKAQQAKNHRSVPLSVQGFSDWLKQHPEKVANMPRFDLGKRPR